MWVRLSFTSTLAFCVLRRLKSKVKVISDEWRPRGTEIRTARFSSTVMSFTGRLLARYTAVARPGPGHPP